MNSPSFIYPQLNFRPIFGKIALGHFIGSEPHKAVLFAASLSPGSIQGDHMPDAMADRRSSPRYSLIVVAALIETGSNVRISARTSDVSRTGCYVDTLTPLAKGKTLRIILTRGDETFQTDGRVTYISPGLGMGIQFEQPVDTQQLAVLNRWLEKASPLR